VSDAPPAMEPPRRGERVLDTVGLYCPVPIIRTAETMRTMRAGEILEVLSDDRVILLDMPAWCRSTGNPYLGYREEGREMRLFVRKRAAEGDRTP
jgi:tRNA 2-thiouridine synthesizing protein A